MNLYDVFTDEPRCNEVITVSVSYLLFSKTVIEQPAALDVSVKLKGINHPVAV